MAYKPASSVLAEYFRKHLDEITELLMDDNRINLDVHIRALSANHVMSIDALTFHHWQGVARGYMIGNLKDVITRDLRLA